jgi:hypothetical protein
MKMSRSVSRDEKEPPPKSYQNEMQKSETLDLLKRFAL